MRASRKSSRRFWSITTLRQYRKPTRQGVALFANYLMDHLRGPGVMRNAREAASQCSAPWVENATLLQRRLREALVDFYKQSARSHPRIEDQASAFAEAVIAEVGPRSKAQRSCRSSGCSICRRSSGSTRRRSPGRRRLPETGVGREGRHCIRAKLLLGSRT